MLYWQKQIEDASQEGRQGIKKEKEMKLKGDTKEAIQKTQKQF